MECDGSDAGLVGCAARDLLPFSFDQFFPFPSLLLSHDLVPIFLFPFQTKKTTSIPYSAATRPERWLHPAATSWWRDEAAHAGASLRLLSPSNLAPPPAARRLPPVGLILPGSWLVDPARGRVAGPPDTSTPAPMDLPSCSLARVSRLLQCTDLQQLSPGQP